MNAYHAAHLTDKCAQKLAYLEIFTAFQTRKASKLSLILRPIKIMNPTHINWLHESPKEQLELHLQAPAAS